MEPNDRLPHGDRAVIPPEKVAVYLLNALHVQNSGKAQFFERAGYSLSQPERLAEDLKTITRTGRVMGIKITSWGTLYEVVGELLAPNRKKYLLTTAWFIQAGQTIPRLATAYPKNK